MAFVCAFVTAYVSLAAQDPALSQDQQRALQILEALAKPFPSGDPARDLRWLVESVRGRAKVESAGDRDGRTRSRPRRNESTEGAAGGTEESGRRCCRRRPSPESRVLPEPSRGNGRPGGIERPNVAGRRATHRSQAVAGDVYQRAARRICRAKAGAISAIQLTNEDAASARRVRRVGAGSEEPVTARA